MLTNFLKTKATIQIKTAIPSALGQMEEWDDVGSYWCRRMSVDVATKAAYQKLNTVITDKFIFRSILDLRLGQHRIIHKGKTYELVESAQHIEGNTTVAVSEAS